MFVEVKVKPRLAVVAAVQLPSGSNIEEASLAELRELAETLGYKVVNTFVQKRSRFDAIAYLDVGKRDEIRCFANNKAGSTEFEERANCPDRQDISTLLVDHEVSPSQARNLENEVGCKVMDRTMAILEIFHRNARSRAQVEIAHLR